MLLCKHANYITFGPIFRPYPYTDLQDNFPTIDRNNQGDLIDSK